VNSNPSGLAVFIGKSRPYSPRDTGKVLLSNLARRNHAVTGVFLYPGDPLFEWAHVRFPTYFVHPFLTMSFYTMKNAYRTNAVPEDFLQWIDWFSGQSYERGLSFFSGWIPPSVFELFEGKIVNFHPGPLPELPGYEPETMAVLLGLDIFYGTLHVVEEKFDSGEILWHSPPIKIGAYDGPVRILYKTTIRAVRGLPRIIKRWSKGTLPQFSTEGRSQVLYASSKACRRFAVLDWEQDGVESILRKNRAFNEQEISLDLLVHVFGEIFVVEDAKSPSSTSARLFVSFKKNTNTSIVGEKVGTFRGLGIFRGAPVFTALNGYVVLLLRNPSISLAARTKRLGINLRNQPSQLEKIF